MAWVWLTIAIALEVLGTSLLRLANGFERIWPFVGMLICFAVSFGLFTVALQRIDLSVAYAVWAGVGTAAIAGIGVLVYREPVSALKLSAIGLIVFGVVLLNLTSEVH